MYVISVIVPVYNVERYLRKCIESILNQTYESLEVILVDDGSTDSSGNICDFYAKQDSRVRVIHKKNGGLVSARKAGTEIASGDYIINVDGDDWIEKDRFFCLVKDGLSTGADMIYMNGYWVDFGSRAVKKCEPIEQGVFLESEIEEKVISKLVDCSKCFSGTIAWAMWMWAIKREILQQNQILVNDKIGRAEDQICNYFSLLSSKKVALIEQSSYHYMQREESIIHTKEKLADCWYAELKHFLQAHNAKKNDFLRAVFMAVFSIMATDYRSLLDFNKESLFPFTQVKRGDKLVIYGAGNIGSQLVEYLVNESGYEIVAWVDNNSKLKGEIRHGCEIQDVNAIKKTVYDYILITIMEHTIADGIKRNLIAMGIEEENIAMMDPKAIRESAIPLSYRCEE